MEKPMQMKVTPFNQYLNQNLNKHLNQILNQQVLATKKKKTSSNELLQLSAMQQLPQHIKLCYLTTLVSGPFKMCGGE